MKIRLSETPLSEFPWPEMVITGYPSKVLKSINQSINQLVSEIWVGNYDKYKSTGVRPFYSLDGFYELQKGA